MEVSARFPSNVFLVASLLLFIGVALSSSPVEDPLLPMYDKWISDYGRIYQSDTEKQNRFEVFKRNYQFIQSVKIQPDLTYTVDLNEFADLTNEEFIAKYAGFKSSGGPKRSTTLEYVNMTAAPSCINWGSLGAVTPIKNQGNCGDSWAFSATGAIEGICEIKTGKLVSLSEQELVDCCSSCGGCNGICVDCAFQWVISNGGITTESNYPYISGSTGTTDTCNNTKIHNNTCSICSYQDVTSYCESCLMNAVASQPVSVAIDASGSAFQFYSGGIFTGPCGTNLNLAVLVIGYGPCTTGTAYWIVKNSWGTSWGESGYIRMARNVASTAGLCGIAIQPSYPIAC